MDKDERIKSGFTANVYITTNIKNEVILFMNLKSLNMRKLVLQFIIIFLN